VLQGCECAVAMFDGCGASLERKTRAGNACLSARNASNSLASRGENTERGVFVAFLCPTSRGDLMTST